MLVREVERVMNDFCWSGESNDKGIGWKVMQKLCVSKKWGGMGFRRLREFYVTMLSKQAWRLIQKPSSLVARV